jgi:hypothetical protein
VRGPLAQAAVELARVDVRRPRDARGRAVEALQDRAVRRVLDFHVRSLGRVRLSGERYARVRASNDPLVRGLMDAYAAWCRNRDWCAKDPEFVAAKSSTLFDTVAVYLAISRDLVKTERAGVRVTEEGMTVPDPSARPLTWAVDWASLDGFEEWLTDRLTAPAAGR